MQNPKHSAYSVSLVGAKMFISNVKLGVPKFVTDVSNDTFRINGAMQSVRDGLYMYMPITQKYKIQNECNLNNYLWIHQPKVDKPIALMVESRLTTPLQTKMCNHEKFFFLEQTIRSLINMVPDEKLKVRGDTNEIDLINKQLWQGSNHLQRLEILGGHPFLHFAHNNISVIDSLIKNSNSRERQRDTLFDILFSTQQSSKKEVKRQLNMCLDLIAEQDEVSTDLCGRSIINVCLDYQRPGTMAIVANKILDHLLNCPFSYHHYHHMMSLYD